MTIETESHGPAPITLARVLENREITSLRFIVEEVEDLQARLRSLDTATQTGADPEKLARRRGDIVQKLAAATAAMTAGGARVTTAVTELKALYQWSRRMLTGERAHYRSGAEVRYALLAFGFIRGRAYRTLEARRAFQRCGGYMANAQGVSAVGFPPPPSQLEVSELDRWYARQASVQLEPFEHRPPSPAKLLEKLERFGLSATRADVEGWLAEPCHELDRALERERRRLTLSNMNARGGGRWAFRTAEVHKLTPDQIRILSRGLGAVAGGMSPGALSDILGLVSNAGVELVNLAAPKVRPAPPSAAAAE